MSSFCERAIKKCNLHTHTSLCDGLDTPEEMVLAAINRKMDTLGFSGHSLVSFDLPCCMSKENELIYRKEVSRLKEAYQDRLHILMGLEQDFFSDLPPLGYDYVIGSVHYLHFEGKYYPIDLSRDILLEIVNRFCGGDVYRFLRMYYEHVAQLPERTACDIVGHFDLVMKFNEDGSFFDQTDPRYLRYALDALDTLLEKDLVFEINTGAVSRGHRRLPYPAPVFLRRIAEKRGNVTVTSDAHKKENLLFAFSDAVQYARAAGLGSLVVMEQNGWKICPM